jgi:hypothetical protein
VKRECGLTRYRRSNPAHIARQLISRFLTLVLIVSALAVITPQVANAATVTATGSNASFCDQTVDVTTGVTAERLADGDCVVKFTAASTTISWTVPAGVTTVNVVVVGGGGAGGTRAGGGGGAGGYLYFPNQTVAENQLISVTVGAGGVGVLANTRAPVPVSSEITDASSEDDVAASAEILLVV